MDSKTEIRCTGCSMPLPAEFLTQSDFTPCPGCQAALRVEIFPALFKPVESTQAHSLTEDAGEASCFYHPAKKAAVPCEGCGRFLCGLCDVELNGVHLCPTCLESGKRKGKIKSLQNSRVLYDSIALALSLLPVMITAPMALYYCIRYWNAPSSLIPRSKTRFVIAGLLAILQMLFWAAVFISASKN